MDRTDGAAREVVERDLADIVDRTDDELGRMAGQAVLITGGAGFLGHSLVRSIARWNQTSPSKAIRLTVFDNLARGAPPWLTHLEGDGALELVRHDMVRPLPADTPPFDWIVHAASIASPSFYRRRPIDTMDANVTGLRSLLDQAVRQGDAGHPISGLLFFSSSEIYGDPDAKNIPTAETFRGFVSCTGPRACYDEAKRYGETLCVNFWRQHGLPVKVARPFNNYGPGLKISDGRVIPDFARDILAGRDLTMLSDGTATRTFCYVADAVTGYWKVLVRGRPGEAYNIGVETPEISMRALAESLIALGAELFGYTGRAVFQPSADGEYLVDNPNRRCPVIAKARSEVGYAPTVPLDEGLRRSLLWYAGNREGVAG